MDLKLLQVFRAVYTERSVSRAAIRLGLSQPAVSHALARLRASLRDPLFMRIPGGVAPTAKADRLAAVVTQTLQNLEMALQEVNHFDPETSRRTFRLYMTDIGAAMFLPRLFTVLHREAPHISLEVEHLPQATIATALETGSLDMAIGVLPQLTTCEHHPMIQEHYVVLARAEHPAFRRPLDEQVLSQLEYVWVRSHPETRRRLEKFDLQSNIRLTLPHFMALPPILSQCNLVTVLPARLATYFQNLGAFNVFEYPLDNEPITINLYWYWRFNHDPGHLWLRNQILKLFKE